MAARTYKKRVSKKISVQCDYCGKEINITASRARYTQKHFCNRGCYEQYIRKDLVHLTCPICGKHFTRKQSAVDSCKDANNMTCSVPCSAQLRKILFSGEKNHQYGLTGNKNSSWKSDERVTYYNYKLVRAENHPFRDAANFVCEHRLVAEKYLLTDKNSIEIDGVRYLNPECVVHHIDFNKRNNSVDNLYVFESDSVHTLFHNLYKGGRVKDLDDFLEYYQTTYVEKLYNYDWLYQAYILYDLSINKISQLFNMPYKSIQTEIYKQKLDKIKKDKATKDERLKFIVEKLSTVVVTTNN